MLHFEIKRCNQSTIQSDNITTIFYTTYFYSSRSGAFICVANIESSES